MRNLAGMVALTVVVSLARTAGAAGVTPIERLGTPWLQELYEQTLRSKETENPRGLCRGAQGLFRYDARAAFTAPADLLDDAGREELAKVVEGLGQESMLVTVLDAVKAALQIYIDRHQDERTKRAVIIAGPTNVAKPADVHRFVERAIADPRLSDVILARAAEFGPGRKLMYHVDTVYGRKETPDAPTRQSAMNFFVLVDTERGELSLAGNGDCEF